MKNLCERTKGGWMMYGSFVLWTYFLCTASASAASPVTLRYQHHLFTLHPSAHPEWTTPREIWLYQGKEIRLPAALRVDGDDLPDLPPGLQRGERMGWNLDVIRRTVEKQISSVLDREPGSVVIRKNGSGTILFEGIGMPGRTVDAEQTARLIVQALGQGITEIALPVTEVQPSITVDDPALRDLGIREVVTLGESNFRGSPVNRRHNIAVGLSKFNGVLIPQGATFSFNEILGPVNASTGYRRELVILGDRTLPEYGGGLCQVSSTAYRGVWEYGFPIMKRQNHSFAVSYYGPQGTDATVYPPNVDMQFLNDSPGALLIQTHVDGDSAFFIYYGTRDDRRTSVIGPFTWGHVPVPAERTEYTTDIPVGERKKVGSPVPGVSAAWFRVVQPASGSGESVESTYSIYQARPLFYQIGVEPGAIAESDLAASPADAEAVPE